MSEITRRGFLAGCSAAIAALSGSRFNTVAFAGGPQGNNDILLVVFLRGGMDGLSLLPPIAGADRGHYESFRPNLRVPTSGPNAAIGLNSQFGLHPAAAPLHDLFTNGNLALVPASGQPVLNRSHFDAMQFVELGTPGDKTGTTGWLTRHMGSASNLPPEIVMPSLAVGALQPQSFAGSTETLNLSNPDQFNLQTGPYAWRSAQRTSLRRLYQSDLSWLHDAGVQALDALDIIELNVGDDYMPANGAVYPNGSFGDHLTTLAQLIKLDLGLQVATLDLGGWDTHGDQGSNGEGYFASIIGELASGLAALYQDLDGTGASNYTSRLTVVVQSEFGREVRENGDRGTEHGYGNTMMVLGGNVNGGIYGNWPGLHPDALIEGTDIAVTTDYRSIVTEILLRRQGNPEIHQIFPGFTADDYQPLGLVNGPDVIPNFGAEIFADSFETGDLSAWSTTVGE